MVDVKQQADLEAGIELAHEEMDRQLYQPTSEIEHLITHTDNRLRCIWHLSHRINHIHEEMTTLM